MSSQRANTNPRLTMKTAECLRMCDHLVDNRHQRFEYKKIIVDHVFTKYILRRVEREKNASVDTLTRPF